jgi:excisionase family DNA binding protein
MSVAETNTPRYLSLAEAGTVASLSERTLRRAIKARTLRAYHLGRNVRIELAELRRWIEADGAAGDLPDIGTPRKDSSR